jgi:predicted amidohydrolase YtcJ
MKGVAASGELKIDVGLYIDILVDRDMVLAEESRTYKNRFRVAGYKLTIDGSPQGFTALRDRPYYNPPEGFREDYAGYAAVGADEIFDVIDFAFKMGVKSWFTRMAKVRWIYISLQLGPPPKNMAQRTDVQF